MSTTIRSLSIASFASALLLTGATSLAADTGSAYSGRAAVYQQLEENSLEHTTTADRIRAITMGNVAPTEIWRALEHGEKVECLDCIPQVAKLLYNGNAKTREISAWWLRRRIFGVFGPGEVYSQVINTLKTDTSDDRRAYAAEALGEFLLGDGVPLVANAAVNDQAPVVRVAAVHALERLNDEGPTGELATAIADQSPEVRLAALQATTRINVFSRIDAVAGRLSDESPDVRKRAAEVLGSMRAADGVVGLIALSSPDRESDPRVRTAAVAALGRIADPSAKDAVTAALSDPDALVQSVAKIALRRL
ncbi:MAG TPA: HEAT repeat domain-containing protein [Polyangiaceae bacterium]|nr:HEAT repeat domain-containing protein [Polyangiaceae bacterium]